SGRFNVIVANPPYISSSELVLLPREVACHDPRRALNGGEDGLAAYRAIIPDIPRLLTAEGTFATEVGAGQAETGSEMMEAKGLLLDGIYKDLAGIARCVTAR